MATHSEAPAASRPKRKLVLFADGTGNAFTKQESSVWRLYEALDHTQPDQISYYIKGVGTAGWAPLAALDGATGIGVPWNVRKLYRFLCWNWQPGDEIYVFGFSRGSFTARTLVGLIASQGLVPAVIDKVPVSHAEMERNIMSAWRAYRRESVPWTKSLPTIWITRIIRDLLVGLYHRLCCHRSYADVREAMAGRTDVEIEFLGLFDTVEAFGVPIEELRTAIDWAIWPISFRNHRLTNKVRRACHALSLDDERTTFHPLRFDQSALKDPEQIKEVWFAGVHSDIGGGYPECTLSFVPLVWMAEQIGPKLRFQPGEIDHFRNYQSAIGPMHDSRSGAAVLYRYGPRQIGEGHEDGGPPIVHFGVVARMLHGSDDYAPVMLPASAKVLLPDGRVMPLTEDATRAAMKSAYLGSTEAGGARGAKEAEAFTAMSPPDPDMANLALDTVWWRRVAYFSLLIMVGVLVALPPIGHALDALWKSKGLDGSFITSADYGFAAMIGSTANLLEGVLPSFAAPWLDAAARHPVPATILVAITLLVWLVNARLRDRIHERARLAWNRPHRRVSRQAIGEANWLLGIGRWMRLHAWPVRVAFAKVLLPAIFLILIFGAVLVATSRSYFNWRVGTGEFCMKTTPPLAEVGDEPVASKEKFAVSKLCWASGLTVTKGIKYRIWVQIEEPWFDRTIMSGVNGFKTQGGRHYFALPILRLYRADWFQPVVRIGKEGSNDLPLRVINGMTADELPRHAATADNAQLPITLEETPEFAPADSELRRALRDLGNFEPIPETALPAARDIWRKQGLAELMVAEFEAPESGELFLYVNDAIPVLPFLKFYDNNSGTARVEVQRIPMPPPPTK